MSFLSHNVWYYFHIFNTNCSSSVEQERGGKFTNQEPYNLFKLTEREGAEPILKASKGKFTKMIHSQELIEVDTS